MEKRRKKEKQVDCMLNPIHFMLQCSTSTTFVPMIFFLCQKKKIYKNKILCVFLWNFLIFLVYFSNRTNIYLDKNV